jgi:hypothetical protein
MRINAIPLDNNNCLALQFEQSLAEYLNTVIVCFENYENMLSYKNELNELRDESWKIPLNVNIFTIFRIPIIAICLRCPYLILVKQECMIPKQY